MLLFKGQVNLTLTRLSGVKEPRIQCVEAEIYDWGLTYFYEGNFIVVYARNQYEKVEAEPVYKKHEPEKEPRHNPLAENCVERGSAWMLGERCRTCEDSKAAKSSASGQIEDHVGPAPRVL